MKSLCLFLCLSLSTLICVQGADELPSPMRDSSNAMQAAVDEARMTVDGFIDALLQDNGTKFSVKVAVEDGDQMEQLWLGELRYDRGRFVGKIGNKPHVVKNVSYGDKHSVKKNKITDWAYFKEGEVQGGFTAKVLLAQKGITNPWGEQALQGGEDPNLIGRWKLLAADSGTGAKPIGKFILEVTREKLTFISPKGAKQEMGAVQGINVNSKPKQIDISKDGQVGFGIYELGDTEETLLLLIRNPGQVRINKFKGDPEGMMFMLERE
jgi:uncharacterized protein YegJ (DUF2314 family)